MRKTTLVILMIFQGLISFSQEGAVTANTNDRLVILTVIGQGKTQDEAKQSAFRSAIEQAFGAFISSKTEILNDILVKDEIVSITNGNIQKFDILSNVTMPDNSILVTLNVSVSINKLTTFCQSKGVAVEFGGELFAYNLRLKKVNIEKEVVAINNLRELLREINTKSFDFKINTNTPTSINGDANSKWYIESSIYLAPNDNFKSYLELLTSTLKAVSITSSDLEEYKNQNISVYPLYLSQEFVIRSRDKQPVDILYFRNKQTLISIVEIIIDLQKALYSFKIDNGISVIRGEDLYEYYLCMNSGRSGYKNGNGSIVKRTSCPSQLGLTEDDQRIKIAEDVKILQYFETDGFKFQSHNPYRLLSDLNPDDIFLHGENEKEYLVNFLDVIKKGIALYTNSLYERMNFKISITETRSEEEIMRINKYEISPDK